MCPLSTLHRAPVCVERMAMCRLPCWLCIVCLAGRPDTITGSVGDSSGGGSSGGSDGRRQRGVRLSCDLPACPLQAPPAAGVLRGPVSAPDRLLSLPTPAVCVGRRGGRRGVDIRHRGVRRAAATPDPDPELMPVPEPRWSGSERLAERPDAGLSVVPGGVHTDGPWQPAVKRKTNLAALASISPRSPPSRQECRLGCFSAAFRHRGAARRPSRSPPLRAGPYYWIHIL